MEEAEMVMEVVNKAYKIELGSDGVAFKNADRFASLGDTLAALPHIWVARINNEVVGVIGVDVKDDGSADLGPIAVCSQGKGVGGALLAWAEDNHPVTTIGVVSCRTDVMPWYERKGYKTFSEIPLEVAFAGTASTVESTRGQVNLVNLVNHVNQGPGVLPDKA